MAIMPDNLYDFWNWGLKSSTASRIYIQLKENLIVNSPLWISDPKRGHFMLEFIQ